MLFNPIYSTKVIEKIKKFPQFGPAQGIQEFKDLRPLLEPYDYDFCQKKRYLPYLLVSDNPLRSQTLHGVNQNCYNIGIFLLWKAP